MYVTESRLLSDVIENGHVGVHIVQVVGVGRILLIIPLFRRFHALHQDRVLRLRLVVHTVETDDVLKKPVFCCFGDNLKKIWSTKIIRVSVRIFKSAQRTMAYR